MTSLFQFNYNSKPSYVFYNVIIVTATCTIVEKE